MVSLGITAPPPPANDAFANAATLTGPATGSNVGAPRRSQASRSTAWTPRADHVSVWWNWTPPASGLADRLDVRIRASTALTGVYTGASVGAL